jgi:peptide/nickel transport system substrate-binding protein
MLKNPWSLLLAAVLALSALSCAKTDLLSTTAGKRNEKVLGIDVPAPFGSLDPCEGPPYGSTIIFPLLYSHLFVPGDDGKLEPDLATQWDYNEETLTWTIQLRDDALFHDGRRVTSKNVEYSIRHSLKDQRPQVFSSIDWITQITDTTLRISLKANDAAFPMKIWEMTINPEPQGGAVSSQDHPIGSGPFKFSYRMGAEEVGLTAFNQFYGGRPSLDGMVFNSQPDGERSWARLLAEQTDVGI